MFGRLDIIFVIIFVAILNIFLGQYIAKNKDKIESKIEKFIVSDAQDFHNYKELKKSVLAMADDFNEETLQNPPDNRVVDYDKNPNNGDDFSIMVAHGRPPVKVKRDDKVFMSSADFGFDPPKQYVSCANSSIAEQYKQGDKSLLPFDISCNKPNKLTAENYYKTHYKRQIAPLEDYSVRGYNYLNYTNTVDPNLINRLRILSQNTKGLPPEETKNKNIPLGWNYSFHNTPAMRMP